MDDLVVFHRHESGPTEMHLVRQERVDHVVVTHLRCPCGTQRAVVSRVATDDVRELVPWPYPVAAAAGHEVTS